MCIFSKDLQTIIFLCNYFCYILLCSIICAGGASLDLNAVQPKPCSWITDATWLNLVELSNLHQFSGILDQVGRSQGQWKQWFSKDEPESEVIPDGYDQNLDVFHR